MSFARSRFCLSAFTAACVATAAWAQMPAYTKAAPLPPALATANSIFISNAGSESDLFPAPFGGSQFLYSGDPDRAYTEFYAALKSTGDFTLLADPAKADLVLELRLLAPHDPVQYHTVDPAMFRLAVYDAKSHYILWTITRTIEGCARQSTCDKNFDTALSDVLHQFLQITGKAPTPAH